MTKSKKVVVKLGFSNHFFKMIKINFYFLYQSFLRCGLKSFHLMVLNVPQGLVNRIDPNKVMVIVNATKRLVQLKQILNGFILCLALPLAAQQSPADKYCTYLQELQVQAKNKKKEMTAIESIINFVNDLTKKLTLEALEKEALSKKMTFEEFQKWANETHSIKVNDHYKSKYLQSYINNVCGAITYSATFGATADPEMSSTAEKQFDPTGYPYATEIIPANSEQKK